jgi:pSer/pThr/pTyr-binding forkhead associated (FHA) protein
MDLFKLQSEAANLPSQAAHWPERFRPLRLLLQPSGLALELTRPDMVIGRHTGVDVRLPLPDVSRRHCRFVYVHEEWQVVDLDSLNGVYVNGQRVPQATLHHGDTVGIGGFKFEVNLPNAPQSNRNGSDEAENGPAVIQSIADVLPPPTRDSVPPHRKAS